MLCIYVLILVLFLVKWFHRKTFYLNFYGFYLIEPQTFLPFILIKTANLLREWPFLLLIFDF